MARSLNHLAGLKAKGLGAFDGELRDRLEALVADLRALGVFLVPVGELECWVPTLMQNVPRLKKAAWATAAAERIEEHGPAEEDVWKFVSDIAAYLEQAAREKGA